MAAPVTPDPTTPVRPPPSVVPQGHWRALREAHTRRVDQLVAAHLARRARQEAHPVEDFLFTYYTFTPARLRRWHPGVGVVLEADDEALGWAGYHDVAVPGFDRRGVTLNVPAVLPQRSGTVERMRELLVATASRPAQLGCFGLHEWAMVYRTAQRDVRHSAWPLRLGAAGTDAVVEAHRLRCTHFDAFRFFTDEAVPRNELTPTRELQIALDQPGCLHATMDLYKWAAKLSPAAPSSLVVDCFELARDVRVLDMRAAPYDLRALGYEPVAIETPEGKAEYVTAQRAFAERAVPLRSALVGVCDTLLAAD
jgi:hypothetical protein